MEKKRAIRSFRDLQVYQGSLDAVVIVRAVIEQLPASERFALGDQLRRAAASVPANIAEGYAFRQSARHFRSYLRRALGSCNEVLALLDVARRFGYLSGELYEEACEAYEVIGRQLYRLAEVWR
ncbi:MAG: four helix bundle protein [Candidatus Korarchaeota archaeon]|nr:four helix bundle protein [Candidatus Korarchaeota archaeon]